MRDETCCKSISVFGLALMVMRDKYKRNEAFGIGGSRSWGPQGRKKVGKNEN